MYRLIKNNGILAKQFLLCFYFTVIGAGFCTNACANDFGLVGGNRAFSLQVSSFKAQRFKDVVPRHYDFSCGSAALATLLKYHYDIPLTEQKILDAMFATGNQDTIKTQGFSLLDMKRYLASIGYQADGYSVDLGKVTQAGLPGIVLINTNGYMHFVVLKGLNEDYVLLGDPALGTRKVTRAAFLDMWNNIFFVIRNDAGQARLSFSHEDTWAGRRKTLFDTALSNQALASFSVHTAMTPNIYTGL